MDKDKQRIAIAEACGHEIAYGEIVTIEPRDDGSPTIVDHRPIPDYLNDLNAMHEAEKVLRDGHTYWAFIAELDRIVKQGPHVDYVADRASATAAQRAEAFLRTIGKWEE